LRFLAVNTDADINGWTPERVLARGSFVSQLRRLEEELPRILPPDRDEVRVLLLHHSLAYTADVRAPKPSTLLGRLGRWWYRRLGFRDLEINLPSRRRLLRLLTRFDIPVILTGHTHTPMVQCFGAPVPGRARDFDFLEACCGTTTQANKVPPHWPAVLGDRELDPNSLVVHQLLWDGHTVTWRAEVFGRTPFGGFGPAQDVNGRPAIAELPVWPRP
jgi:hypothetical protein